MADEDVVLYGHALADKGVRGDLAILADEGVLLDLDERPDLGAVANGAAVETALWGAVFTVTNTTVSSTVYMIEQLTLNEDGLVDVVAVEFPCTSTDNSLICLDILSESNFKTD